MGDFDDAKRQLAWLRGRGVKTQQPAADDGASEDRGTASGSEDRDAASPVTLYDVARLAKVSIATVSRVVHGQDLVRDSTRARVLEVIEQLGYVPDGAAQSLSRRRKDVIGLVCVETRAKKQYDVESMALLFYDEVLRGVESLIRAEHRALLITYVQDTAPDLPRLLSLSGKVDGLLFGEGVVPSSFMARLAKRLPVVIIAGSPDERAADVVTADNRSGSVALVTHLVEDHGRRRLYQVKGPPTAPDAEERSLALAAGARKASGLPARRHVPGVVRRAERRGGRGEAARHARRRQAGRCGLRERPVGDRRAAGLRQGRRACARGGGRGRLRRHLPRQPVQACAHHGPSADAPARRAGLRPAA